MNQRITTLGYRAHARYTTVRDAVLARAKQIRDDTRGIDNIPWTMIIMIGGAVLAVAILAAVGVYVTQHLANIPN